MSSLTRQAPPWWRALMGPSCLPPRLVKGENALPGWSVGKKAPLPSSFSSPSQEASLPLVGQATDSGRRPFQRQARAERSPPGRGRLEQRQMTGPPPFSSGPSDRPSCSSVPGSGVLVCPASCPDEFQEEPPSDREATCLLASEGLPSWQRQECLHGGRRPRRKG